MLFIPAPAPQGSTLGFRPDSPSAPGGPGERGDLLRNGDAYRNNFRADVNGLDTFRRHSADFFSPLVERDADRDGGIEGLDARVDRNADGSVSPGLGEAGPFEAGQQTDLANVIQAYFGDFMTTDRQELTAMVGQAGEQVNGIYEADYREFNRDTYVRGRETFDRTWAEVKELILGAWWRDIQMNEQDEKDESHG